MKTLTLTLEEELCLMNKYNLDSNELLILRILLLLQDEGNEELFKQLLSTLKSIGLNLRDVLSALQMKEVILKSYKIPDSGEKFSPYDIPVNKTIIKMVYRSAFEMGK